MSIHSDFRSGRWRPPQNPPAQDTAASKPPAQPNPVTRPIVSKPKPADPPPQPVKPSPQPVKPPPPPVKPPITPVDPPPTQVDPTPVVPPCEPSGYKTFSLKHIIPMFTAKTYDPNSPEYEPYHWKLPKPTKYDSYWDSKFNPLPFLEKQARLYSDYYFNEVRSSFYETEFEQLQSFAEQAEDIRATQNWGIWDRISNYLFGTEMPGRREFLYSQSYNNNSNSVLAEFKSKLGWDMLKRCFLEGYFTARDTGRNAVKVAELTPRIMLEKGREIQDHFDSKLKDLLRKCYVVLEDPTYGKTADQAKYLEKLLGDLREALENYQAYGLQLETSSTGKGKTTMKKLADMLDKNLEKVFSSYSSREARKVYRVDELKKYLEQFFGMADAVSENIRARYDKIVLSRTGEDESSPVAMVRAKINEYANQLFELSDENQKKLYEFGRVVEHFEHVREAKG